MDAKIDSYWGSLPATGPFALYLIDDDGTDGQCDGTQLKQIGGATFDANEDNRGKLTTSDSVLDILSENSHEGAYLQLRDASNNEIGCCEIMHKKDYWIMRREQDPNFQHGY